MQKARALRRTKWALRDAFRMIQTNNHVLPHIGYQRDPREIITTMNRDRPGGHKQLNTNRAGYIISDPYMKQKNRKKDRREQKRYAKECLEFHWQWLQEEEEEIARDFLDWYFEDDYQLDYEYDWDDYEDYYDPLRFNWDYGCSYEEYYIDSSYNLTRESMEIEVEYILNLYTTHGISHHEAKKRIVDLL